MGLKTSNFKSIINEYTNEKTQKEINENSGKENLNELEEMWNIEKRKPLNEMQKDTISNIKETESLCGFTYEIYRQASMTLFPELNDMIDSDTNTIMSFLNPRGWGKTFWIIGLKSLFEWANFENYNPIILKNTFAEISRKSMKEFFKLMSWLDKNYGTTFIQMTNIVRSTTDPRIEFTYKEWKEDSSGELKLVRAEHPQNLKSLIFVAFSGDNSGLGITCNVGGIGSLYVDEFISDDWKELNDREKETIRKIYKRQWETIMSIIEGGWREESVVSDINIKHGLVAQMKHIILCANPYSWHPLMDPIYKIGKRDIKTMIDLIDKYYLKFEDNEWFDDEKIMTTVNDPKSGFSVYYILRGVNTTLKGIARQNYENILKQIRHCLISQTKFRDDWLIKILGFPPISNDDNFYTFRYSMKFIENAKYDKNDKIIEWVFMLDDGASYKNNLVFALGYWFFDIDSLLFKFKLVNGWSFIYKKNNNKVKTNELPINEIKNHILKLSLTWYEMYDLNNEGNIMLMYDTNSHRLSSDIKVFLNGTPEQSGMYYVPQKVDNKIKIFPFNKSDIYSKKDGLLINNFKSIIMENNLLQIDWSNAYFKYLYNEMFNATNRENKDGNFELDENHGTCDWIDSLCHSVLQTYVGRKYYENIKILENMEKEYNDEISDIDEDSEDENN